MEIETKIRRTINEFYPSIDNFSIEKYPNNTSCALLIEKCRAASTKNLAWLSFLNSVNHKNFSQVIDESMLVGGEPCYRCSIVTVRNEEEAFTTTYIAQISIIFDCYFLYKVKTRKNDNPPPLVLHLGYDFDLFGTNDPNYRLIIRKINECFLAYEELTGELVRKSVSNVRVPAKFGFEPPTIFECLFGVRMF